MAEAIGEKGLVYLKLSVPEYDALQAWLATAPWGENVELIKIQDALASAAVSIEIYKNRQAGAQKAAITRKKKNKAKAEALKQFEA